MMIIPVFIWYLVAALGAHGEEASATCGNLNPCPQKDIVFCRNFPCSEEEESELVVRRSTFSTPSRGSKLLYSYETIPGGRFTPSRSRRLKASEFLGKRVPSESQWDPCRIKRSPEFLGKRSDEFMYDQDGSPMRCDDRHSQFFPMRTIRGKALYGNEFLGKRSASRHEQPEQREQTNPEVFFS